MRKLRIISFVLALSFCIFLTVDYGQASTSSIDKSQLDSGIISINYEPKKDVTSKVMISKDNIKYTYTLKRNVGFPLQFGDGEYAVSILENGEGNTYRLIETEQVNLKLADINSVFLQPIQIINWNEAMAPIERAKELTKNVKDDKEKVVAIYNYITQNISYDHDKAKEIHTDYIPSIEETFKSSKGICYDYSALFAAMLRSVEVPTKLVMGRKNDIESYHAWNQVYLRDTNEWITVDTTYDSILIQNDVAVVMIKDKKEYLVEKQY